jgi:glycosyltransferase involved in cell wall biosynthesis
MDRLAAFPAAGRRIAGHPPFLYRYTVTSKASPPATLRVLVLAPHPWYQERGTPMAVDALVRVLTQRGYEVDLLVYHEGDDRRIPGCKLRRIPRIPGVRDVPPGPSWKKLVCDAAMFNSALRLARQQRIDLVHAVEESSAIALLLDRLYRIPYIYDMDSSLPQQMIERYGWLKLARPLLESLERRLIRGSTGVVVVSRAIEQVARRAASQQLVVRLEDFSLLDDTACGAETSCEQLHETINKDGPIVLYVGNLMPYQGIDLLLAAFQRVADRHPTAQLVIIGGSDDGVRSYRRRAAALGIGDRVHLLGPRPTEQLGCLLAQATTLVSPRTVGVNTPMKIYSYMDSGTPVLATRLPTHTQVLDDEVAHLVSAEAEPMAEGMLRLLTDEALRRGLAERARQRVHEQYSRAAYDRTLNAFYDGIERRLERPRLDSTAGGAAR